MDLVTDRRLENFELNWEWRAAPGTSGSLRYFVAENSNSAADEVQFGEALLAQGQPVKAPGEWNQSRLVVEGQVVEQWLNGKLVKTYQVGSKVKPAGQLGLTCRGAEAAVRDLKIRELK